jgi:hypothetical protein
MVTATNTFGKTRFALAISWFLEWLIMGVDRAVLQTASSLGSQNHQKWVPMCFHTSLGLNKDIFDHFGFFWIF